MAIFWENLRAGRKLVPCAQRLAEKGMKATPLKCLTHVNSVAFLCVAKCGVNNRVLLSGMVEICRKHNF